MKGPDLDTDSDGLWSTEEIDTFASDTGISIDTDEIISTYDTDGDGAINEDERVALGRDNAFNLPSPKDMMNQMKGFSHRRIFSSPMRVQRHFSLKLKNRPPASSYSNLWKLMSSRTSTTTQTQMLRQSHSLYN